MNARRLACQRLGPVRERTQVVRAETKGLKGAPGPPNVRYSKLTPRITAHLVHLGL